MSLRDRALDAAEKQKAQTEKERTAALAHNKLEALNLVRDVFGVAGVVIHVPPVSYERLDGIIVELEDEITVRINEDEPKITDPWFSLVFQNEIGMWSVLSRRRIRTLADLGDALIDLR